MTITHRQKADAGARFIEAITKRIEVRTTAQAKANKERADNKVEGDNEIKKIAAAWMKKHGLTGNILDVCRGESYRAGPNVVTLNIRTSSGDYLPARTLFPEITKRSKEIDRLGALSRELCAELEFLHGALNQVPAFQAYVSRLWAPESKVVMLGEVPLRKLIEDFIAARRPAVCKI